MFDRRIEEGLLDVLGDEGIGCIVFSPLAQGLLTDKYLGGVPESSRASKQGEAAWSERLSGENMDKVRQLNEVAQARGQNMAQLALAWVLRHRGMTSALIGASRPDQIEDAVKALDNLGLSDEELARIDAILGEAVRVA
jgi:L-glyceraldehyde 3-phosphate reductase